MLAPYFDEIELIFFESSPDSLPTNHEIKELFSLANEYDLSYNIHLPLDISLGAQEQSVRRFALETIKKVMDLTASLFPTTYTLHLPYEDIDVENEGIKQWKENTYRSMKTLCTPGFNSRAISIETLNYPLEWIEHILVDFNLSVCMDLGHLILYGLNMKDIFDRYKNKTSIIHLHGANERRDHQALSFLSTLNLKIILNILKQFKGIVSLEVFSFDHLSASLKYLENVWQKHEV
jgi:sugar phosphate isomerase/epimerase